MISCIEIDLFLYRKNHKNPNTGQRSPSTSPSSAYWTPLATEHGWPVILETDDQERGGKMAAFVLRMLEDTALVAPTPSRRTSVYVWGLRWKI